MKMNGPYDWVPPAYWYDKAHKDGGGAWLFNSETSAGPDIPTMDTLKRMMSSSELDTMWKSPSTAQYHRSSSATFANLKLFGDALTGRYGKPASLDDFVRKAQLAQYENVRAEFESHSRNFSDSSNPATGIIYWMLNSGWTSLHWQLFYYYLDQNGAYYGAKKAGEPLHIQYSYDNRSVVVVNSRHGSASGLTAKDVAVYGTINGGATVAVKCANGAVSFADKVDGGARLTVDAGTGLVAFPNPSGGGKDGSRIGGGSEVRITARVVVLYGTISGADTHVVVTLTPGGSLTVKTLDGPARLHYRRADPAAARKLIAVGATRAM